jgi:hypothetical protein
MNNKTDGSTESGCVAQLSWIARKFSNLRLEETQIFPHNGQNDPEYLALMARYINSTFPIYLPSRYIFFH